MPSVHSCDFVVFSRTVTVTSPRKAREFDFCSRRAMKLAMGLDPVARDQSLIIALDDIM